MSKTFSERVKGSFKNRVFESIPDGQLKDWLWWQYQKSALSILRDEILALDIEKTGKDEGFLFVKLRNGLTFYGWKTPESSRRYWKHFGREDGFEFFDILEAIIVRYKYPQSIPIGTPLSKGWSHSYYHHSGVIGDMRTSPEQKLLLTQRFIPKLGNTVLDVGAFMGYGTMKLSQLVGPSGQVIAFECNPSTFDLLTKNILENRLNNVLLMGKAAWNKSERIMLGEGEPQGRSLIEGIPTVEVEGIAIDSLKLDRVDFISFTINGAELEALEGARQTLERLHPNLSVIGWVYRDGQPIWKRVKPYLESLGYKCLVGGRGGVLAWKE